MEWLDGYFRLRSFEKSGRFYEAIGIRRFYTWISSLGDAEVLPERRYDLPVPEYLIKSVRNDARYYEVANLTRLGMALPPTLYLAYLETWFAFGCLVIMCGYLFVSILTERYKRALTELHLVDADAQPKEDEKPTLPRNHLWFTPKKWEKRELYQFLGMDWAQGRTLAFVKKARATNDPREQQEQLEHPNLTELVRFEKGTRAAETIHLIACAFNVPAAYVFIKEAQWVWALYILVIIWGDLWLSLLQRYHRVRTMILIRRYGSRLA
jgi:hypothetical protein